MLSVFWVERVTVLVGPAKTIVAPDASLSRLEPLVSFGPRLHRPWELLRNAVSEHIRILLSGEMQRGLSGLYQI